MRQKIIDNIIAKCIKEHANIYSLYNIWYTAFFLSYGTTIIIDVRFRLKIDISCLTLRFDLYQFHTADELKNIYL